MSRKRTVCMIAAAVVSACMLAGIMLNYIVVDFSKIADKIGLPDLSFAGSVIGFFSGRDNAITMSGLVLLRNLFNGTGSQFPQGMDSLLRICMILVGVPYLICAVTLVLSFLRRTWSYIVTIVLACAGECAVIGGLVLILPKAISSHIHSLIAVRLVPEEERTHVWPEHLQQAFARLLVDPLEPVDGVRPPLHVVFEDIVARGEVMEETSRLREDGREGLPLAEDSHHHQHRAAELDADEDLAGEVRAKKAVYE